MFRIGEGRYGISKKERERNSPCLGVERLSEVRHIHNSDRLSNHASRCNISLSRLRRQVVRETVTSLE